MYFKHSNLNLKLQVSGGVIFAPWDVLFFLVTILALNRLVIVIRAVVFTRICPEDSPTERLIFNVICGKISNKNYQFSVTPCSVIASPCRHDCAVLQPAVRGLFQQRAPYLGLRLQPPIYSTS